MKNSKGRKKKIWITAGCVAGVILVLTVVLVLVRGKKENITQPEELLKTYFQHLENGEYQKMYRQLSNESQKEITEAEFVERNQKIYEGIEAENFQLTEKERTAEEKTVGIPYTLSMETLAGSLELTWKAVFVKEEEEYRLSWSHSMIFPDLGTTDKVVISKDEAQRGSIYDRNGVLLAGPQIASSVGLVPGKMQEDPAQDLENLAQLLGTSGETIQKKLEANWVKEDSFVPIRTIEKVNEMDLNTEHPDPDAVEQKSLETQLLEIPGVMISDTEVRGYPMKEAAAHLLGYVQPVTAEELEEHEGEGYTSTSLIGKSGLEKLYEKELRGSCGYRISIVNKDGEEKEVVLARPREDGKDITLTIDAILQRLVFEQFREDQSATAAINPKNGEVLALLSTPAYDDNAFVRGMSQEEWDNLNQDEAMPMQNRFKASWCPGSSLKPVIAGIGLSTGTLNAQEDEGQAGLSWQKDAGWGDYYVTTLHEYQGATMENALIYSDNIYFAKAALKIGDDVLKEQFVKMGFGEDMPFDFGLTASQYSNEHGFASEIQLADSGYGQGQMLVNPVHMASIYSAFVNDGNMIAPYLKKEEGKMASYWKEGVFTPEAARQVEDMLIQVIENEHGTGHAARIEGVTLAGKTGTAELKTSKEDADGTELGWFNVWTADRESPVLFVSMAEDVKGRGGSGYVVDKIRAILEQYL